MVENYRHLLKTPVTKELAAKVISIAADVDLNLPEDQISPRKRNIIHAVATSVSSEMSYKGENAWGLLNGVTHYTTHKAIGATENKIKSKMYGAFARIDKTVYDLLVGML